MVKSSAKTVPDYLASLPRDRIEPTTKLLEAIRKGIPKGFEETMCYGMIAFVVPHSRYPNGYHCDPTQPLPFISIASQKNYLAFYHMGLYCNKDLLAWFQDEWSNATDQKLDMGKSCVRMKKLDRIPYGLFTKLAKKITVKRWIEIYESLISSKK